MLQRLIDGLLPGYLIGLEGTAQSTMEKNCNCAGYIVEFSVFEVKDKLQC
jgi:hypothetical protein